MATSFKYGNYQFRPFPLFTINNEPLKTPDGTGYGVYRTIDMDGWLILTGNQIESGTPGVTALIENLFDALNHDGRLLLISCDSSTIVSGYPVIESYSIGESLDNFTRTAKYNITFKMPTFRDGPLSDSFNDSSSYPPFIESCSESWDIEFQDDRVFADWTLISGTQEIFPYKLAVTHTVETTARITYTGSELSNIPWDDARLYTINRLNFNSGIVDVSGILELPARNKSYFTTYDVYNQYRQVSINKSDGSIRATETFIVVPSGAGSLPTSSFESFDINITQNEGIFNVSINGEIQGLEKVSWSNVDNTSYGPILETSSKINNAKSYYNIVKNRFYERALTAYTDYASGAFCRTLPLSPIVKTRTIGVNPINGTITYNYEYDNTLNSAISGDCILSQNITIDDQLETNVFAEQIILGRAVGPILQDIGTVTAKVRTVNIELSVIPPTSLSSVAELWKPVPTGAINSFVNMIYSDLTGNYEQVFISSQNQNWNFTLGRYNATVGYTYVGC